MQLQTDKTIFPDFEVLLCPQCGFEYIHILSVKVADNKNLHRIDAEGYSKDADTEETQRAASGRGARIYIEYACENGHHGYLIFKFHKGNTFVEHEKLASTIGYKDLWRD